MACRVDTSTQVGGFLDVAQPMGAEIVALHPFG